MDCVDIIRVLHSRMDVEEHLDGRARDDRTPPSPRYLTAVAEEDDPSLMIAALGDVARARNMTRLAEQTGLTRMGLYKALSGEGNPSYATIAKVAHALGLKIVVRSA